MELSIGEKSAGEMPVEELSSNRFQYFLEGLISNFLLKIYSYPNIYIYLRINFCEIFVKITKIAVFM